MYKGLCVLSNQRNKHLGKSINVEKARVEREKTIASLIELIPVGED